MPEAQGRTHLCSRVPSDRLGPLWHFTASRRALHIHDWNSEKYDFTVVLLQKKRQSAAGSATLCNQIRSHLRAMSAVNYLPPFATVLNAQSLEIQPNTGGYVKYIRELHSIYADEEKFQQLLESRGSDVAYRVNELRFTERGHDLITGISVLNPGKVGSEFFMTRGHLHQRADRPETYYCLSGRGILLMEDLEGRVEAAEMQPGSLVYVPPFWVHRSVNIGSEIFATLFSYPADAGQNFEIVRKAGGFKLLVVENQDKGWRLVPNPRYAVRARAEIEAYTQAG
jgi:glucose-6-phosphate isomerase, archaeal